MTSPKRYRLATASVLFTGIMLVSSPVSAQDRSSAGDAPARPVRIIPKPKPSPSADPKVSIGLEDASALGLAPDFQLSLSPTSKNAVPTQFTVKNAGYGAAEKPTLLSVEVTLLPMPSKHTCTGDPMACAMGGLLVDGFAYFQLMDVCPAPLESFQAEIQALEPGQTQVVSKSMAPVSRLTASRGSKQQKNSYFKEVTLVCVFEIKAVADAKNEVSESNEQNNAFFHYVEREVAWK